MYALKKEVIVMRAPPHFALFMSKGVPGATHDYTIHKDNYTAYVPYLFKSPLEQASLPGDHHDAWALLLDSGYVGPEGDTPHLRRIAMAKPSTLRTAEDRQRHTTQARIRVPVEQFFGRFYKLWGIFRHTYRLDHTHFDSDFDSCALLTNENLRQAGLTEADKMFLLSRQEKRRRTKEEQEAKRKEQVAAYLTRKRKREEGV